MQVGPAASENVRARSGKIDVILAVVHRVGGAVVTGRHRDRHAKGCCGLAGCIERIHGLRGPVDLGRTPGNRDHAGFVLGVVDRVGDRVDEPLVGVGCKINHDAGARRDRAGHFDIEHDLAIGAAGGGGTVLSRSNRHRDHFRRFLAEGFEISGNVGLAKAAAEFDDADGLARGINTLRKLIELGDLDRRKRGVSAGMRLRNAAGLSRCSG